MERRGELAHDLLALAQSPMVKGRQAGIAEKWSIAGNLAVGYRARKFVADHIAHGVRYEGKW